MDQTPRSESPAMTAPLTGPAKGDAILGARYAVDFPSHQDPYRATLGEAVLRLAAAVDSKDEHLAELREAIGLPDGAGLCDYRNFEGKRCLLDSGHVDRVGEGWHVGLGWTSSGRVD